MAIDDLDALAQQVSDLKPIDWIGVESQCAPQERVLVDQMRLISGIARVHRRKSERALNPLRLAAAVSDGELLGWQSLESSVRAPDESGFLKELRLIAEMASLQRQIHAPAASPPRLDQPHRTPSPSPQEPPQPPEALKKWGDLDLRAQIGEGAFSRVYKAYDTRLARELALKLSVEGGSLGPAIQDRTRPKVPKSRSAEVLREAQLLARVRHPNVVCVFGADSFDGVVGIWMEYIDGRHLADIVHTNGPFGAREAILIGLDLSRALAAVHAAGLIHGDLKAQNVMREAGGRIVLMDFGAGRDLVTADDTLLVEMIGTPLYMAPELFRGDPGSATSDIYSLGVLLDHLVTGNFPIAAHTLSDVRAAHQEGRRRLLRDARPDLPSPFIRVVERAMAADPGSRYPSAGALEGALGDALTECDRGRADMPVAVASPGARAEKVSAWTSRVPGRRIAALATTAAVLAAMLAAGIFVWRRPVSAPPGIASIGVLPLQNLSGDPQTEYFADGMTDLLTNSLAKVRALKIISRTSTVQFRNSQLPLSELADRLNADALIEGSVLLQRDRVRIVVRLIHAGTDAPIWADTYERDVRDVMALQGDVVRDIARGIRIAISPQEQQALTPTRPTIPEAQDAYLRGRYYQNRTSRDGNEKAVAFFDEALRIDPNYAPAYAALATAYIQLDAFGVVSTEESAGRARTAVEHGLALDEQLPELHVVRGDLYFLHDWKWADAEKSYRRAINLNPSYAYAYAEYAWFLAARGRLDAALEMMYRAEEGDPLSLLMKSNVAGVMYYAHQFDAAIAKSREIIRIDPTFGGGYRHLMRLYAEKGMFAEAIAAGNQGLKITGPDPGTVADFARVQALAGHRSEATRLVQELRNGPKTLGRFVSSDRLAFVEAALDNREVAMELLQRAIDERSVNIPWLLVDPRYDSLRNNSRFASLLQQLDLPVDARN